MDYEGNYFPDEEELTKGQKLRKRIIRYTLYGLVAIVYIVAFWVIFSNCEADIYEEYIFSDRANALYDQSPEDFEIYELFPTKFMNFDGSVQIAGVAYAHTANELELGIKYNKNLLTNDANELPEFTLTDTNGNIYKVCNTVTEEKGRYRYLRIAFEGVTLDLDCNTYINSEASVAADGEGQMYETFSYKLHIAYPEGADIKTDTEDKEKGTDELVIFNNVTPIQLTKLK